MKQHFPRTPFATRLSGSAKETELRIRNIFQWKKLRPPVWVMALAALVILTCGGLVSCQSKPQMPQVILETQYYDVQKNYIEIPRLALPDGQEATAAILAINQALDALEASYSNILDGSSHLNQGLDAVENQCLLYPTATDRYLSLLFFQDMAHTDLNTAHLRSLVYDAGEQKVVTMEEALALAETTEEELYAQLSEQIDPTLDQEHQVYIQSPVLEAFRIGADGQPVFYLTARVDDAPEIDAVSGADHIFAWERGAFSLYDQYAAQLQPLVPADACMTLGSPLWYQWYFSGSEPEGGFYESDPSHYELAALLAQQELDYIFPEHEGPQVTPLLARTTGDQTLLLARETSGPHVAGLDNLVLGVWDQSEYAFVGDTYSCRGDLSSWTYWEDGNTLYLLWSNCAVNHGMETSSGIGYFSFNSNGLQQLTTLPDPARNTGLDFPEDALTIPRDNWDNYWYDHKAVPATGGLDLYVRAEGYDNITNSSPQWIWLGFIPFTEGAPFSLFGVDTNMYIIKAPILEYFQNRYSGKTVYWVVDQPDQPQIGDYRLENLTYLGTSRLYETTGVAYEITVSNYYSQNQATQPEWRSSQEILVLSYSGSDNSFQQVLGSTSSYNTDTPVEDTIQKIAWNLLDPDVCLYKDYYPQPLGPGNWQESLFPSGLGQPTIETLDGWEPIYNTGDYWDRFSTDGLTALRYYNAGEGRWGINTLDVTRTDFYTPAGIRVGSTRYEVLAAYPDIFDTPYWHDTAPDFPGQDYLWYCDNEEGWGASILFFFQGDVVSQIRLNNMFN